MIGEKTLFSKMSDEWETPQDIYDRLNEEFHFTLDACATEENTKCDNYYTLEDDGLSQNWGGYRVWCNPPYSQIAKWVEKAFREGTKDNTLVVLLIPSRTDTRYFHDFILNRSEIRFIKGRIHFSNSKHSAPFPSIVVIFRGAFI